jgi:hypothetical protein
MQTRRRRVHTVIDWAETVVMIVVGIVVVGGFCVATFVGLLYLFLG